MRVRDYLVLAAIVAGIYTAVAAVAVVVVVAVNLIAGSIE